MNDYLSSKQNKKIYIKLSTKLIRCNRYLHRMGFLFAWPAPCFAFIAPFGDTAVTFTCILINICVKTVFTQQKITRFDMYA